MADLIIRGMDMPKKGKSICIEIFGDGGVHEFGNCYPCALAFEVETPHGRLIDADAIVAEMEKQAIERDKIMELCKRVGDMENYFRCSNNQTEIVSFMRMLNNAPTIVPAEGGGEDG